MSDPCVRSITFTIPSNGPGPATKVYIEEQAGNLVFTVDVLDTPTLTGDLRGLFFHIAETALPGLQVINADPSISETRIGKNNVIDLGNGANMIGAVKGGFDIGIEFGDEGIGAGKLDITGPVSFTLDGPNPLTLDMLTGVQFGSRITSIGAPGGDRIGSTKSLAIAPAAPDARDDSYSIFEDGKTGLNDPSQSPSGVKLLVLANDTDADGNTLTITDVHGALHGTVTIVDGPDADALPGDAVMYTPDQDYAGTDSFEYCITDNAGGTDFATVSMTIVAVADIPTLSYTVAPGATVNEIKLTVTATQVDADSSEFIDRIELTGIPAGTTASPPTANPVAEPDQIVQTFTLTLPTGQDTNFDLGIRTFSKETSNGDEQVKSATLPVKLDFTENNLSPSFKAIDQSIWGPGDEVSLGDDRFIGFDDGFADKSGGVIGYDVSASVKAGFQSTLKFNGGDIDANLNYDLGVDTTYNKTTDSLLIQSSQVLTGGDFTTKGPSGSYKLDFIFNYAFKLALTYDIEIASGNLFEVSGSNNFRQNILDLSSDDLSLEIAFPKPFDSVSATLAWPNISTDASPSSPPPGEFTSSGESNNFLQLNLDVDQLLATIFLGGANPFDIDFAIGHIELLDLDVSAGLNFLQRFVMQETGLSASLKFEDGSILPLTFGSDILLQGASAIDAGGNNNGVIDYKLILDAQATLRNDTDIGLNFGYNFDVLKITSDLGDLGPVYSIGDTLPVASFGIYDSTFGLNFVAQEFGFSA